ncbi:MAG: histidinol-phosphate transaminase [Natronomonas sp.]|uniref:histidinol-phosphate transaminase n=1 Tax=Natronomonas sp. TaxID=2184060 RepID=UPI00286FBBE9|nr:histidinol-phosphate transaminase [Natronomonas sp.]MDR9429809.1 histidinol-phosphate transaminase [Natronomonas sp.]
MHTRDLSEHVAYEAGRGIEEVARELGIDPANLIKLSSNENAFGPAPKAIEAIKARAPSVHSYPKSSAADLRARLAERHDVASEQIWLANGGDGAIDCLSRAMIRPGDGVLVPDPGFAYYGMSSRYHHGSVGTYPIRKAEDFEQSAETVLNHYDGERIVYLTSPHNPTGSEMSASDVETIATDTDEETLVVVDEAYVEYSDSPSAIELIDGRDDIAVIRTFSKVYGLAGLRLGFAVVPEAWADAYARVNTPFAASEIACRAGLAALDDDEHMQKTIETAAWARAYIYETFDGPTWESAGNFVLCEVGDGGAVTEAAQREGIIVRDTTSFGLPECVRITCGTREETKRAVEVFNGLV